MKQILLLLLLLTMLSAMASACFYGIPCDECDDCCGGLDEGHAYGICMIGCGRTCI